MRHNLLIVDDEELICQGFRARLEYLHIHTDEIFESSCGREAIEIVKENPVDIVVTDIRMPDMNGLTLIMELQKLKADLQFVVLSGYAEFSYAETAIRLGVKAYLLKPLSNEELEKTFRKLYEEMERSEKTKKALKKQRQLSMEQGEYRQEKAVKALLSGALDSEKDKRNFCVLCGMEPGEYQDGLFYSLAVVRISEKSPDWGFQQNDNELIRFSVRNIFSEIESRCHKVIVNSLTDYRQMHAVFFMADERKLRNEVERVFLCMQPVLDKMGISLTVGVSRRTKSPGSKAQAEAETALRQQMIYGGSSLYFYEDINIFKEKELPISQVYLLDQYIERKEMDKIERVLQEIFSEKLVRKYGSPYLQIMWVRILNMILRYYDQNGQNTADIERLMENLNLLDQIASVEELRQRIMDIILESVHAEKYDGVNAKSKIQLAIRYIQRHYNENIVVNDLAERFGMSPNYFSSTFKRQMHQSAIGYLSGLRVEKAKELLLKSELNVVDIAKTVGYEDSQYFFRVFKKYTGATPLTWREQNRK